MKTWWDYYPVMLLALLLPFLVLLVPTGTIKGHIIGGGPVRQAMVNSVSKVLPPTSAEAYIEAFNTASVSKEVVLSLPVALNLSGALVVFFFLVLSSVMGFQNWMKRGEYSSQRKASKGAR